MPNGDPQRGVDDATLDNLGHLIGRERVVAIRRQYQDLRTGMAEVSAQTPTLLPEDPTPDYILSLHASDCEVAGDWTGAEAAYRAILDWPDASAMDHHAAHFHLSRLCEMLGRESEALAHAREASSASRQTDLEMLQVMYLAVEAQCLLRQCLVERAEACIDEMCSLLPADSLWDHLRARAHVLRARSELARDNAEQAEANVQRAMVLMEPQATYTDAAGIQATIASCWMVRAQLLAAREDRQGAVAAWREAVRLSRLTATEPRLAGVYAFYCLANMLHRLSAALQADGCVEESGNVATERKDLLSQFGLPLD